MVWWNPWAEMVDLRAAASSEHIANRALRAGMARKDSALATYRSVNEMLQRRNYMLEREIDALKIILRKSHRRDPVTGRLMKAGE